MGWRDILKGLSARERMDAEDFAPEEMGEFREEQADKKNLRLLEEYTEKFNSLETYIDEGNLMSENSEMLPFMLKRGRMFLKKKEGENAKNQWRSVMAVMRMEKDRPLRRRSNTNVQDK